MSIFRSFLIVPLLAALAGCEYMQSPSILTTAPPTVAPAKGGSRESRGGFSVLVDAPGQPTAARAVADVGAFAQRRGFTSLSSTPTAARYVSGKIALDVFFREQDSHVVAQLHCVGLSRRFAEDFYRDFNREYAPRYGEENPIIATDFAPYSRPAI